VVENNGCDDGSGHMKADVVGGFQEVEDKGERGMRWLERTMAVEEETTMVACNRSGIEVAKYWRRRGAAIIYLPLWCYDLETKGEGLYS
jgi:hypothetical protein